MTNPAARTNAESPIYGMPILDVDRAQNVIVLKRSMNPGFAGIDNELYFDPKTTMLFGDAKDSIAAADRRRQVACSPPSAIHVRTAQSARTPLQTQIATAHGTWAHRQATSAN